LITRNGETVAVPIIDPVTNTYLFSNCAFGGSAKATADKLVADIKSRITPFNTCDDLMDYTTAIRDILSISTLSTN